MVKQVDLDDIDSQLTDNDFKIPNSQVVCLILYLYSMEPPFYEALNNACRSRPFSDSTLQTFGPFACAMNQILFGGHLEQKRFKKIEVGSDQGIDKELGLFGRCFFLYRGVQMREEWIQEWKGKTKSLDSKGVRQYQFARMNGYTSTTKCLLTGIDFSFGLHDPDKQKNLYPVLFVISVRNYDSFSGFRLDLDCYSAHPEEKEYLLMEGVKLWVLDVDDYTIKN